jgi:hypothetical protein
VLIATIAITRSQQSIQCELDGKKTTHISSFLVDAPVDETPEPLAANRGRSFQGSIVLGVGFTFEDGNPEATPTEVMFEILAKAPASRPFVKPYVSGEQVNNQAAFQPQRYVIDFGQMPAVEASAHRELWEIVESKVKPRRAMDKREKRREIWWQFAETNPGLRKAIEGHERVLVANRAAAKFLTFSFLPSGCVYSNNLYVFPDPSYAHFAVMQSRVHELWARMFGTSLGDQLCYTGTSCYENYPFPDLSERLESAGLAFYNAREKAMKLFGLGLTPLGNRVNDVSDVDAKIVQVRQLYAQMDSAVLEAYGWNNIVPEYEFTGDYERDDGTPGDVRQNFTEEVRDEILRRLLALHAERLKAEQSTLPQAGKADTKAKKPKKSNDSSGPELF